MDIDKILSTMLRASDGVSDLNFSVGQPPLVEANGRLIPAVRDPAKSQLTGERTAQLAEAILGDNEDLLKELAQNGACDCSYTLADGTRFRANVFQVQGNLSIVLRVLPTEVPTLQGLGLPSIFDEIVRTQNGLVLVTGATGSGKSTTLAAMINAINESRQAHIITLEDPVEFKHVHKRGTINQREKGSDFPTFAAGLRAALRQAPKVILVGELRDAESMEIALKAAETGHLVLSTLHTIDAGQTVSRIVGMFPQAEQVMVRTRLSQVLRYIVGQRLLPKLSGSRVAALEIMGSTMRVRELIERGENEDRTFYNTIADSRAFGWQTFDQHISALFQRAQITRDTAFAFCSDRGVMRAEIDRVRSARGESTADLGELELEIVRE